MRRLRIFVAKLFILLQHLNIKLAKAVAFNTANGALKSSYTVVRIVTAYKVLKEFSLLGSTLGMQNALYF